LAYRFQVDRARITCCRLPAKRNADARASYRDGECEEGGAIERFVGV